MPAAEAADALSKADLKRFRWLAGELSPEPFQVPRQILTWIQSLRKDDDALRDKILKEPRHRTLVQHPNSRGMGGGGLAAD